MTAPEDQRRSWFFRRRRTDRPAVPETHSAEVWYVRVNTFRRKKERFDPYYIAHCSCGWVGQAFDACDAAAETQARDEAFSHTPQVSPEVWRPID